MDHEHHHHHQEPFEDGWHENGGYNPHHHSPVQDYNGFSSYAPLSMEPIYGTSMHPPHPSHPTPRTTHPHLQPLIMPQWPSMLTSQSTYQPTLFPSAPVPITPASATPVSATSTHSRASSTPRKTLTDSDRRRMCLYHEENPTVKQTEIGAMFGVERSTVSKVLRQKEKYLYQDDGSRSPIKRSKGKFPDIERALANWARNHQRQGLPLTDAIIRDKARFFAQTVGNSESHLKANSTSWLEKFKQKNHLMGARSRKGSIAEESEDASNPPSNSQTPGATSPTSPGGVSPATMATKKSEENLKNDSPNTYDFPKRRPFHSLSSTSLSSVFTDTAPSTFSAGPTSPTSLSSPFFTPDSACGPNPFMGNRPATSGHPGSDNFQRPRSQTFPLLVGVEQYASPDVLTSKYISGNALDSPMADMPGSLAVIDEAMSASPSQITSSMQPPPIPNGLCVISDDKDSATDSSPVTPSQEEAARALELVWTFFQSQTADFVVEPQEYLAIGKLMEKLRIKRSSESLPMGIRRGSEPDFGANIAESVDVLH
ncbi:CenpB-DNA-bind-domain-containing protein [Dothidotthia symphoricarpi CBS 119687]|uniref:CenpB-DNA-bind-domain-containing protein n=1 Tax=Dothidotthia symphoricarpi CBS 119687 TaxID=1392245 RepID=A0A6A6A1S7_9PLEO|nr:CenpB-DNA-bind-domain-containing protein [Dothidotthia symphoricarpi CBS 119687]KAF2125770.1 CenpB-DNA-bind-domain-containing protein [Dothidotthia symphoricarpi CBS 119687]